MKISKERRRGEHFAKQGNIPKRQKRQDQKLKNDALIPVGGEQSKRPNRMRLRYGQHEDRRSKSRIKTRRLSRPREYSHPRSKGAPVVKTLLLTNQEGFSQQGRRRNRSTTIRENECRGGKSTLHPRGHHDLIRKVYLTKKNEGRRTGVQPYCSSKKKNITPEKNPDYNFQRCRYHRESDGAKIFYANR